MRATRQRARGFTLVEATITVAILALAAGVTVVEIGSLTSADLRASASKLAGAIRATYDDASLSSQTYRLVFELEANKIRSETTSGMVSFVEGQNAHRERDPEASTNTGGIAGFLGIELPEPEDDDKDGDAPSSAEMAGLVSAFLGGASGGGGGTSDGAFAPGAELALEGDVRLLDIWVEGMNEPAKEGTVYLYFFPGGYTQDAVLNLQDDNGNVFHLVVRALTGKTRIDAGYREHDQ